MAEGVLVVVRVHGYERNVPAEGDAEAETPPREEETHRMRAFPLKIKARIGKWRAVTSGGK